MFENIREKLFEYSEKNYKEFTCKLSPCAKKVLGVRIPVLRKLAKEIAKDYPIQFLEEYECRVYEDKMLKGLVLGYAKLTIEEKIKYIRDFVQLIDDWAVCDICCNTFKLKEDQLDLYFEFLSQYRDSNKEYELRFMVVMFLNYFLVPDYVDRVLDIIDNIHVEHYYTNMAVAWLVAEMGYRCRVSAVSYIMNNNLDKFTLNKAIQKMQESFRISDDDKKIVRKYKKK